MKIYVLGTRGIPYVAGGVETHCERLYPRLAAMGMDVTVVRRRCYVAPRNEYRGVRLIDVYAPRIKSLEAICHTLLGVVKAGIDRADVVHLHAVGPSLLVPLARLLGMKVVVTNHGHDYEREKWGRAARAVLRMGERVGVRFANEVIAISQPIADVLESKYGRGDVTVIPNGVEPACVTEGDDYLKSIGVERGRYVLAVGRLVKEKGFHDLIKAFGKIRTKGFRLVIAGDADHRDDY
ncbi:glycosyltransferase, partial [uncultured Muribaculum sp.]